MDSLPVSATTLIALNRMQKNIYSGTVPHAEVQRRRAVNKRARAARKAQRRH
jgi:hypothetical protein